MNNPDTFHPVYSHKYTDNDGNIYTVYQCPITGWRGKFRTRSNRR